MIRSLLSLVAVFSLSGCILVVDSDEFGGRHGGIHGSTWVLEVVVWHGHSYRAYDTAYKVSFGNDERLSGTAGCTSFDADYAVSDDGTLEINRFRAATQSCVKDDLYPVFVEQLPRGGDFEISSDRLTLRTDSGADFTFVR